MHPIPASPEVNMVQIQSCNGFYNTTARANIAESSSIRFQKPMRQGVPPSITVELQTHYYKNSIQSYYPSVIATSEFSTAWVAPVVISSTFRIAKSEIANSEISTAWIAPVGISIHHITTTLILMSARTDITRLLQITTSHIVLAAHVGFPCIGTVWIAIPS